MTISQFKKHMESLVGCVNFDYNGISCGVDPVSWGTYDVWCGDNSTTVTSVNDVLNTPVFNGKSLIDIWDDLVEFDY